MKKLGYLFICIVVIAGVILIINIMTNRTETLGYKDVRIRYVYSGKNINQRLSKTESEEIKKVLNNRILFTDNPSCGFSKDISFQFNDGDIIYSIALDTCSILKDEKTGKYFGISDEERYRINKILEKYGATFPAL